MSLSKFLTDVGNISALSIKPNSIDGLTAEQLQQKFDKAGVDFKNYIDNTLTEELDSKHEIIDENCGTATDTYSSSSTYAINDISIYQNKIYRCTTAITVAEEFNSSKWVQTSLKDEITSLKDEITRLKGYSNGQQYILVTIATNRQMSSGMKMTFDTVAENTTGGKLTLSNNNVVVGAGVKKVKVSAMIFNAVQTINAGAYTFAVTKISTADISIHIANLSTNFCSNICGAKVKNCVAGDTIYLIADCTGNSVARAGANNTYLLVEIVE